MNIKPVDAMDFITKEELLEELIIFLCEKKLTLLYLYDMIAKPYKYINVFNEFLRMQKSESLVSEK